jgi:hypothetical protein
MIFKRKMEASTLTKSTFYCRASIGQLFHWCPTRNVNKVGTDALHLNNVEFKVKVKTQLLKVLGIDQ